MEQALEAARVLAGAVAAQLRRENSLEYRAGRALGSMLEDGEAAKS